MFKTIVAGADRRPGRGAASFAQVICAATGARLLVVPAEPDHARLEESLATVRAAAARELRAALDELSRHDTQQLTLDVSPARDLRRVADEEHADLIVVGLPRRTPRQRLTQTNHALQVLHDAPCAVAAVPDDLPTPHRLARIGVGVDASPEAAAALEIALELARRSGAALELLAVASDHYAGSHNLVAGAAYLDSYRETLDARVQHARDDIERALRRCAGVPAGGDVRVGDAAVELTRLGADCDLLVLGSRRWGAVRRLALGSTSETVIHHARCPILVPPRGAGIDIADDHPPARPADARSAGTT